MKKEKELEAEDLLMDSWEPEFVASSGSIKLDMSPALEAYRGYPAGSIIQYMSAQEGAFKTSLALQGAVEVQKVTGKSIGYVDAENGLTGLKWIEQMGIDTTRWKMASPETGEQAFEAVQYFIEHPEYKAIILDSIDACVPESIYVSDFGSSHIGNHAKLVTDAIRKFKAMVRKHQKILFVINQMKVNVTTMGARGHKPTGGAGLNFYCKLNIEMTKDKSISQLKEEEYIPLLMKVGRSKLGSSYIDIPTVARQGYGIDRYSELRDYAEQSGILIKKGSWWSYKKGTETVNLGQGGEAPLAWCKENEVALIDLIKNGVVDEATFG